LSQTASLRLSATVRVAFGNAAYDRKSLLAAVSSLSEYDAEGWFALPHVEPKGEVGAVHPEAIRDPHAAAGMGRSGGHGGMAMANRAERCPADRGAGERQGLFFRAGSPHVLLSVLPLGRNK
jgi:hypothetical protein